MTTQYFIADEMLSAFRPYGISENPPSFGTAPTPCSRVYVCGKCGTAWARMEVSILGRIQGYDILRRDCRNHPITGYGDSPPGSLYLSWAPAVNDLFPAEVVQRELEIMFDHLLMKVGYKEKV